MSDISGLEPANVNVSADEGQTDSVGRRTADGPHLAERPPTPRPPFGGASPYRACGPYSPKNYIKSKVADWLTYDADTGAVTWLFTGKRADFIDRSRQGYRFVDIMGVRLRAHHIAWFLTYGVWPDLLDHKNGKRDDNKIENLRECTIAENNQNRGRQANNTSGFRGVGWHKGKQRWRADIRKGGRKRSLGYFKTKQDAAAAYTAAAHELFGEFARAETCLNH